MPTEALEDRMLLSNVTVSLSGGDLKIEGDSGDNVVHVRQNAGTLVVEGLQGTTINGNANSNVVFFTNGIADDVIVDFSDDGDNAIVLENLNVGDDMQIKGGDGKDLVAVVDTTVGDDLTIQTGKAKDTVVLAQFNVEDTINIDSGNGSDKVIIVSGDADDLKIKTKKGQDAVLVALTDIRNTTDIKTANGSDFVFLEQVQTEDLKVNLGQNNDDFYMKDVEVGDDFNLNGASGNDNAEIVNETIGDRDSRKSIEGNTVANADQTALDTLFCANSDFDNLFPNL